MKKFMIIVLITSFGFGYSQVFASLSGLQTQYNTLSAEEKADLFDKEVIQSAIKKTQEDVNQALQKADPTKMKFGWNPYAGSSYRDYTTTILVNNEKGEWRPIYLSQKIGRILYNWGPYGRDKFTQNLENNIQQFAQKYSIESNDLEKLKNNNDFFIANKHLNLKQLTNPVVNLPEQPKLTPAQPTRALGWWDSVKQSISNFFSFKTPSYEKKPSMWETFQEQRKLHTPIIRESLVQKWQQKKQDATKLPTKEYLPTPQQKDSWEKALERQRFFGLDR